MAKDGRNTRDDTCTLNLGDFDVITNIVEGNVQKHLEPVKEDLVRIHEALTDLDNHTIDLEGVVEDLKAQLKTVGGHIGELSTAIVDTQLKQAEIDNKMLEHLEFILAHIGDSLGD